MAASKRGGSSYDSKFAPSTSASLTRVMREFDDLVKNFETGLLRSLEISNRRLDQAHRDDIRREACRLAIAELGSKYTPKYIRHSLHVAESEAKSLEDRLHSLASTNSFDDERSFTSLHNGYFRLYSTELFDLLGQPNDLRLGTLRFLSHTANNPPESCFEHRLPDGDRVTVELALKDSFFVADSMETLPYHTFSLPTAPSVQNRGILSRKAEDGGIFPDFDSWLLFTFLGNGYLKLEVPIEMCADVYGGQLQGRENEEIVFWGLFVEDRPDL